MLSLLNFMFFLLSFIYNARHPSFQCSDAKTKTSRHSIAIKQCMAKKEKVTLFPSIKEFREYLTIFFVLFCFACVVLSLAKYMEKEDLKNLPSTWY